MRDEIRRETKPEPTVLGLAFAQALPLLGFLLPPLEVEEEEEAVAVEFGCS